MIVLDASAAVELLLSTPLGERVGARIAGGAESLHAPHLLDVEVLHALRRLSAAGAISVGEGARALTELGDLPVTRYPHEQLVARAWGLRSSVTAYDAMYVALAEALDARLLTCDGALGRSHGHGAAVEVIALAG